MQLFYWSTCYLLFCRTNRVQLMSFYVCCPSIIMTGCPFKNLFLLYCMLVILEQWSVLDNYFTFAIQRIQVYRVLQQLSMCISKSGMHALIASHGHNHDSDVKSWQLSLLPHTQTHQQVFQFCYYFIHS